ncbi:MAG TPA: hypothetical protein VN679_11575 [Candidatus Acidoferrales bacterium]|nr:hypothetical protein [Candidatus Acidoferrales bacterium]
MRPSRFTMLFLSLLFVFAVSGFAQTPADSAIARATVANAQAGLGSDIGPVNVNSGHPGMLTIGSNVVLDADTGAVVSGASGNAGLSSKSVPIGAGNDDHFAAPDRRPNLPTIDGLNTIATFDGAFVAQAGPSARRDFRFTMVGNDPKLGGTTVYPGNISEVDLQLLNADGSVFQTVPFAPFEKLTLESPNFEPLDYRSGHDIEFGDAVHRAQFFNVMKNNWHTLLVPKVVNRVTITVPFFVNVQLSDGTIIQARSYFTGTAADGNTFVLMLQPLFNFFFDNEVVNEINLGNFTTNGMNMTLFPNTFLFSLNVNNPNAPGGCCVLGFHTFFLDGGFPEDRWITQYASWISPGLFGAGFEDVTALSHELAESYANPFVSNPAPNWQFPGEPANAKVCQANLEEGDPIEVLPNATAAITVKEKNFTFTYHPQNIPLLQWFEMGATSSAIDGAFSFPDETVLPHSALPCPQ